MLKKEQFTLSSSLGKTISGDLIYDDNYTHLPNILFVHGFKGFKDWGAHHLVASFFASKGYRYFKFNLSHSGVTAEQPDEVTDLEAFASNTVSIELMDVDTVVNYIAHTFPLNPIYLIGHSRGGGLVILKGATDERVHKIITWAAISDFSSLWKKEQEEEWLSVGRIFVENARTKEKMPLDKVLLEDFNDHRDEFDILHMAGKIRLPWLILHGDDDVNVKFSVAQRLAQVQPSAKLQKIQGANHVFGASHPYTELTLPAHLLEVCEKSLAFLQKPLV